jgi:hypothetical protein
MNRWLVALFALAICAGARGEGDPLDDPHLTLEATMLVPVALKRFQKDQPKADSKHFDVYIREHAETVEIEFIPEASPRTDTCGKEDCSITIDVGGGSIYGSGITYVVDKRTKKIVKTIYAR